MSAPTDALPLTEAATYVLLSLAARPKHGYAIIKQVAALSDERIELSAGTLYGVLKRFLEYGWIERHDDPEGATEESGRPRKVYGLTGLGAQRLTTEVRRREHLVRAARPYVARGSAGAQGPPVCS
jgi:DNA-binding PadR family transcriptional regulator